MFVLWPIAILISLIIWRFQIGGLDMGFVTNRAHSRVIFAILIFRVYTNVFYRISRKIFFKNFYILKLNFFGMLTIFFLYRSTYRNILNRKLFETFLYGKWYNFYCSNRYVSIILCVLLPSMSLNVRRSFRRGNIDNKIGEPLRRKDTLQDPISHFNIIHFYYINVVRR